MSVNSVLLMTERDDLAAQVSAALAKQPPMELAGVCRSLDQLAQALPRQASSAVVVDIEPAPRRALSELQGLIASSPQTRFVVLAENDNQELLFEAISVGASYLISKRNIPGQLAQVLRRLLPQTPAGRLGKLVTVLSSAGGCGATTLAVNLAGELAQANGQKALVVDLDCHYAAAGIYMGLSGPTSIDDLVTRDSVDGELIRSTALSYSPQLHLLASPSAGHFNGERTEGILRVIDACRSVYGYTIADAPRANPALAVGLANASSLTLIVLQLGVREIRTARALHEQLLGSGVPDQRIVLLVNRYHRGRQEITLDDARKALGQATLHVMRNDYPAASRSAALGKTLAEIAPRSPLRKDLQEIAAAIIAGRPVVEN